MKDLEKLIETIKTSTGSKEVFDYNSVCNRLIELASIKNKIETSIDILKESLESQKDRMPYKNDMGEIVVESKSTYDFDIKAIKKELPEEIFIEAVSITKSRIKDAITEKDTEKKKELIKVYTAIIEKYQTKRSDREYFKVTAYKQEKKATGTIIVK